MKKLILASTMVVLLAAAVFGGQAIASNKPADVSVSEETSDILFDWGSSYRGYPVRMKTSSDNLTIPSYGVIEENYSGVRHVSLTLLVVGFDHIDDGGCLGVYFGTSAPNLDCFGDDFFRTYEFDAESWQISALNQGGVPIEIKYHATITYPSNQW